MVPAARGAFTALYTGFLLLAAQAGHADDIWLHLDQPEDGYVATSPLPLLEVRGRIDAEATHRWDVVIAIDRSESMFHPSGFDVDRDGISGALKPRAVRSGSGALRPHRLWTTDPDDTRVRAALTLARALVRRLASGGARIGLISFGGRARVLQPVGSPEQALEALDGFRVRPNHEGTDLGSAAYAGTRALARASSGPERDRILLILSDGRPTLPRPAVHARSRARKAAIRAQEAGVRIYALAVGAERSEELSTFREMSRSTGGHFARIAAREDLLGGIPGSRRVVVEEVDVLNRTTGTRARALRLFADGSFDGYVPLEPGLNTLEFLARVQGVGAIRTLRRVRLDPSDASDDARELERLWDDLRWRTIEIDLARQAGAGPHERRNVEVEVEPDGS